MHSAVFPNSLTMIVAVRKLENCELVSLADSILSNIEQAFIDYTDPVTTILIPPSDL